LGGLSCHIFHSASAAQIGVILNIKHEIKKEAYYNEENDVITDN
jgi:hypothetical protein